MNLLDNGWATIEEGDSITFEAGAATLRADDTLRGASTLRVDGLLDASAAGLQVNNVDVVAAGRVRLGDAASLTDSELRVLSGGTLRLDATDLRATATAAVSVDAAAAGSLNVGNGRLGTNAVVGGELNVDAPTAVGASGLRAVATDAGSGAATLRLAGDLTLLETTTLRLDLTGPTAAEHDRLVAEASGGVTLAGALEVSLAAGFRPGSDDVFRVIDGAAGAEVRGRFSNTAGDRLLVAGGTGVFDVAYLDEAVELRNFTVVPEPGATLALLGAGLLLRRRRS